MFSSKLKLRSHFSIVCLEDCDVVENCFAQCVEKYGGSYLSGNAYFCSKGCAGVGGGKVTNREKYCSTWDPTTYATCVTNCQGASGNEDRRNYCREGCTFWKGT